MDTTSLLIETAQSHRLAELRVRVGASVTLLVTDAPPAGGRGVVSLAGLRLEVALPAGLQAGQTLPARVIAANSERLVLRPRERRPRRRPKLARARGGSARGLRPAGASALAAALAPAELALPLPNGDALALTLDADAAASPEGEARARFVLHSARLGPIAVELTLTPNALAAVVVVEPAAAAEARAGDQQLLAAIAAANGPPASVEVRARPLSTPRPASPRVAEGLEAYA